MLRESYLKKEKVMENETVRKNHQIYRLDSGSGQGSNKIMDITDVNPEPVLISFGEKDDNGKKLYQPRYALNYTKYDKNGEAGSKSQAQTSHWVDTATLLSLCNDMLFRKKGEMTAPGSNLYKPILSEFKGSNEGDLGLMSRVLTVTYSSHIKIGDDLQVRKTGPVYEFRFKKGPGEAGNNGQIMPIKGKPSIIDETFAVVVDAPGSADAKRFANQVLNYVNAKTTAAIMRNYFFSPIMKALKE